MNRTKLLELLCLASLSVSCLKNSDCSTALVGRAACEAAQTTTAPTDEATDETEPETDSNTPEAPEPSPTPSPDPCSVSTNYIEQAFHDEEDGTIGDSEPFTAEAQSIVPTETFRLSTIEILGRKFVGGTTTTTLTLYEDAGTDPTDGNVLGSATASWTGTENWYSYDFDSDNITLTANEMVWFVFTSVDSSRVYNARSDVYAPGCMRLLTSTSTWLTLCSWEMVFRVNGYCQSE